MTSYDFDNDGSDNDSSDNDGSDNDSSDNDSSDNDSSDNDSSDNDSSDNDSGKTLKDQWSLPDDVTYLNHGSFGPSPKVVQEARRYWSEQLERQPMDFFIRQMENELDRVDQCLSKLVGATADDLILLDNATTGMNLVADNMQLQSDDQVLTTDHEYGAVLRIWRRTCQRAGAKLVVAKLPSPMVSDDEIVDALFDAATDKTKLIVVSHITSPTAVTLPVKKICQQARQHGIAVCIDGPHAIGMLPINLRDIECDYYAVSCHKWLCGPFGSGFLYVRRKHQQSFKPAIMSWGGSVSGRPASWKDDFNWIGTRDPAVFLALPAAVEFLEAYGWDRFRARGHELARYAHDRIIEVTELEPHHPIESHWFGSMIAMPLLPSSSDVPDHGHADVRQIQFWEQHRIEVPITAWKQQRFLRVSCYLYNSRQDIDRLVDALKSILAN